MLLNLLLITNTVVPILCIIGFCHSKKGFQIDHVFVISAGYLYYWMMPLFTYHYGFLETLNFNEKEFSSILGVENYIIEYNMKIKYLIITFGIYASFIIGHALSIRIRMNYSGYTLFQ